MIHFEEQSRLGLLKTIKSEMEDEDESINLGQKQQ
jgi:hypothetical protein